MNSYIPLVQNIRGRVPRGARYKSDLTQSIAIRGRLLHTNMKGNTDLEEWQILTVNVRGKTPAVDISAGRSGQKTKRSLIIRMFGYRYLKWF
jgi:hypothetical protein